MKVFMRFAPIKKEVKMKRKNFGFTLIELLVVISIIGILASLTLVSYTGAQKQTRDTQRRSDLNQFRNGLESYAASNNGLYPPDIDGSIADLCTVLTNFISVCPDDPKSDQDYSFYSTAVTGEEYVLYATLETGGGWEVCSNGRSGKVGDEDVPDSSTCTLSTE
jgi:prepilin-type N-terminal cleavage/methylation domain-containing protein